MALARVAGNHDESLDIALEKALPFGHVRLQRRQETLAVADASGQADENDGLESLA